MDKLFDLERQARMAGEIKNLEEIQSKIIESCNSEEEVVSSLRALISKRRQDHSSIKKLISSVFAKNKSIEFLKILLEKVVEGKIYLEDERISIAEHIKNSLGNDIAQGYSVIKNIPVETFTTISDKRRNAFLFEQFRLALLLKKFEEAEMIMKKVRKGYLKDDEKVVYLNYCILLKIGQKSFLDGSSLYLELNEIDECTRNVAMGSILCIMSSCLVEGKNIIEEKLEMLNKFGNSKDNDEVIRTFTKRFSSDFIIGFETVEQLETASSKFTDNLDRSLICKAIIEHNFFVISKFFSTMKIQQLVEVMQLEEEDIIEFISDMVNEKYCNAKINQQSNYVSFGEKRWNSSVDNVLDKIVLATHLIHKDSIGN